MKKKEKLKRKPKSKVLNAVHEMAQGLYDVGAIDTITMREYKDLCLPEIKRLDANEIKKLRLHESVSQAIFAKILNTSTSTVKQWEQGDKHPQGTSLKLLNLVARNGIRSIF
jgi:putative transcriptional regulator